MTSGAIACWRRWATASKGGKWYSLIDKVWRIETLEAAWQHVRANKGAAGIDGQSIQCFEARAPQYLKELSAQLRTGQYKAAGVRRVEIPKANGSLRSLGIPTVKDRVVQTAVKRVIEPIFEHLFEPTSYGFRPGRGCRDALKEVDELIQSGYTHVVDADIKGYFDNISHDRLCAQLEQIIGDGKLLSLMQGWLSQEIVGEVRRWTPVTGTPQGAVISPLLSNLYLHPLDVLMREHGYRMVRYADDFVILCRSAKEAANALALVRAWTQERDLTLHPEKTHVGDCRRKGSGFEFLGFRFEAGKHRVRKASCRAMQAKIKAMTRRSCGQGLAAVIERLNPVLRGWYNYFKYGQGWAHLNLDQFTRRRLRAMLRKQCKRPGSGRTLADNMRWPNAFFARSGLFILSGAWVVDSRSR